MSELQGKNAIVTGAARGLGLHYAERLAQMGANVAICDKNLEAASEYEEERNRLIGGQLDKTLGRWGTQVIVEQVDATDYEQLRAFADRVHEEFGSIDVLVCNAGGGGDLAGALASELEEDSVHQTFQRNLYSTMSTVRAVARHMKQQRSGKIINVSSFTGTMALGEGNGADYATAKGAVAHYTRYLAQELGPLGITANVVAPGFIATGQFKQRLGAADPTRLVDWVNMSALRRLGDPDDCTNLVEFLASSKADFITGQVICVDGGIVRGPS